MSNPEKRIRISRLVRLGGWGLVLVAAHLSATPLSSDPFLRTGNQPPPNLMIGFDNSASMAVPFLPANLNTMNFGGVCKARKVFGYNTIPYDGDGIASYGAVKKCIYPYSANESIGNNVSCTSPTSTKCYWGDPPYSSTDVNGLYYNPDIRYEPPPAVNGGVFPAADPYAASAAGLGVIHRGDPRWPPGSNAVVYDLTTEFPEMVHCASSALDFNDPSCRRNGIDSTTYAFPMLGSIDQAYFRTGNPYYFRFQSPVEYCREPRLVNCIAATAPTGTYIYPATVRYCQNPAIADSPPGVTGLDANGYPLCQNKINLPQDFPDPSGVAQSDPNAPNAGYQAIRIPGPLTRVDIVPSRNSYPGSPDRTDCAIATNCTYQEELQNFANWFQYYRTRIMLAKSTMLRVLNTVPDEFRVGLIAFGSRTTPGAIGEAKYYTIPIKPLTPANRADFYQYLISTLEVAGTPTSLIMDAIGRHFTGVKTLFPRSGLSLPTTLPNDPVIASCQRNYSLIITDGYANSTWPPATIPDLDNVDAGYARRADGVYDGGTNGRTLADIALYYYQTDLRPAGATNGDSGVDVSENNVPLTETDRVAHQHVNFYAIALLPGMMNYRPDYKTALEGDYYHITQGTVGACSWLPADAPCNWPLPSGPTSYRLPANIDDLWHATAAGRGAFYVAQDTGTILSQLRSVISTMKQAAGSGSAASVSNPVISSGDNFAYAVSYTSAEWTGNVTAYAIDPTSGNIDTANGVWTLSAQRQVDLKGPAVRKVYTPAQSNGTGRMDFTAANLTADSAAIAQFASRCNDLSQCVGLSSVQRAIANDATKLIDYIRGDRGNERSVFRERKHVLGDMIDSQAVVVGAPNRGFADAGYADYKTTQAGRAKRLYIGGNDGMLHAFDAATGEEKWAWVPRTTMPVMHHLADFDYATHHRFSVDGTPVAMDVNIAGEWKTVLVTGFRAGGRGYFALDVTEPDNPRGLWELCADTMCDPSRRNANLGFSYGAPIITKRPGDQRWMALLSSGYNNTAPGDGHGHLFVVDVATGTLTDVDLGEGNGFAQISAWADDADTDNTAKYVYGGDLDGNLWRIDMGVSPTFMKMATLQDASGNAQPVTTPPELGALDGNARLVMVGTGKLLDASDIPDTSAQAFYAIKDTGTPQGNPRANLVAQTLVQSSANERAITNSPVDYQAKNGWYVDFDLAGSAGERIALVPPLLSHGTLIVSTAVPTSELCKPGGDSWFYQLNYRTGERVPFSSGTPSTTVGTRSDKVIVGITAFDLVDGQSKWLSTAVDGTLLTGDLATALDRPQRRIMWREVTAP